MKKKIQKQIENHLLVDSYSSEDTCLEVLFAPYVDDNEVWLTYQDPASTDCSGYPQVLFSSFVGPQEDILVGMNNQFIIFSRSCTYKYQVKLYKDGEEYSYDRYYLQMLDIDDHVKHFLFKDGNDQTLKVFELTMGEENKYIFKHVKTV